jgi:membrane fusion protein (multidrug efflux system)
LPVRIELQGYDPDKKPLFIGTSVVPYVYLNKPLSGPNAGAFLQVSGPQSAGSAVSASGAGK